jgi:hypothetical protein
MAATSRRCSSRKKGAPRYTGTTTEMLMGWLELEIVDGMDHPHLGFRIKGIEER